MARFIPRTKTDPRVYEPFLPWSAHGVNPLPDERRLFIVLTLLSPFLILAAWAMARRFLFTQGRDADSGELRRSRFPILALPGILLLLVLLTGVAYLGRTSPDARLVFQPAISRPWFLALGVLLLWLLLVWWPARRPRSKLWFAVALVGSTALALLGGFAFRLYDYDAAVLTNPVHLNTVLYPITQAVNGQRILVDFLPQYGCYGEMLKPCFALIGLSIFRITGVLVVVQCFAFAAIIWTYSRLLRSGWVLLLCAAALAWLPMWSVTPAGTIDPYFQYFPVRVLFPALSLPMAWFYLRRPSAWRAAAAGFLGGLAVWWNIDTGVVTLASLLGLLGIEMLARLSRPQPSGRRQIPARLLAGVAGATVALAGFYLVLCLDVRCWANIGDTLRYQQIFYGSGFFKLPMPSQFSLWHLLIAVYLLGLTMALGNVLRRRSLNVGDGMGFYLSVLGIGLFSYYQGRPHMVVLVYCSWPAVLEALWLSDRLLAAVRYRLLPRWCALGALPALLVAASCALCLWQIRDTIVTANLARLKAAPPPATVNYPLPQIPYAKAIMARGGSCAIISPYQSLYYAETGMRSGLTGQSIYECLLKTDLQNILDQLKKQKVRHILTEYPGDETSGFYFLGPDYVRTLSDYYHLVDASPDKRLLHWEPRANEDLGADPEGAYHREFHRRSRLGESAPAELQAVSFAPATPLLDPNGQCVSFPYNWKPIVMGGEWTFEVLLTPAATQSPYACLLSTHPTPQNSGIVVQQVGPADHYVGFFGTGDTYVPSTPFSLPANREHYLAITCAANTIRIFVDGDPMPPLVLAKPLLESTLPLTIGNWLNSDRTFHGDFAEVKFSTQALSAEDIARTQAKLSTSNTP